MDRTDLGLKVWWERCGRAVVLAVLAVVGCGTAKASMTVLVGEPYGNFGTMMPVGHASIYLDRVCADGPFKVRMCEPGEPHGVVVARYNKIGSYDWMATPVLEFLYAVESPDDVPSVVTAERVWDLQQAYRKKYLEDLVPDGQELDKDSNEWWESAGAAYDRRLWGYELATTEDQDRALVERINGLENRHAYRLVGTNCANFAADLVNFAFPGVVRQNGVADFGMMSPKQVARSVARYGTRHPGAGLRVIEVPQVPGEMRRSRPVRGGVEALLKTKRYLATLLAIQPEVPAVLGVVYLAKGRWQTGRGAVVVGPEEFGAPAVQVASSAGGDQGRSRINAAK